MNNNCIKHILLCLALLAGTNALAYDAYIDGIYYNFSNGEATVTYMTYKNTNYNSYSGEVTIPSSVIYQGTTYSVTSIGSDAFYGCSGLTSITIPNSVTSIGSDAFYGCSGLTSITIPSSVTSIGGYAFTDCSGLTSVTIPNSVTSIGGSAFYGCSGLTSVTIGNSVTSIGGYAFDGTAWYESLPDGLLYIGKCLYKYKGTIPEGIQISVTIKEGTTIICNDAFYNCKGLTSVTIPESVTSIGSGAFYGCSGLTSVTIPNSVTSIGNWAFFSCSGLTSVTIPESVTSIGSHVFEYCTGLTSVTIPESVTSIGNSAFSGCSSLTSFTIPNSVTSIGNSAFFRCSGLTSVTIPNSVTSIGDEAFEYCSGLTSVTIPESVTSIGSSAFSISKLRNVLVKCTTPPVTPYKDNGNSTYYVFSAQAYQHATLYVPYGTWDDYAFSDYAWYNFNNIRETAMAEEEVSGEQAYTLMDAGTFAYSVYDPVNDCIGTINSAGSINEDNPNHSWQMMEAGGLHYLYNIGAKKYAKREGNSLCLCDEPTPIDVADGDNGLILAGETGKQWALVSNERLSASQAAIDQVTGIKAIDHSPLNIDHSIYNMSGQRLSKPQKGLNIVGGRKVLMK